MDNGREPPATDQTELSISLAASSMINASDMITQEAYQANLKRIQEVKEIVRRLETNNEAAHKNFLVDELEKRAKDGREAEVMLARLRNQPGPSETIQRTNDIPIDKSEVILPTTATLVEVPESHSYLSYSSSTPATVSHPPQTTQQGPVKYQWRLPPQGPQAQSYSPGVFQYYSSPPTLRQPFQHGAALHSKVPVDPEQMGRPATKNMPPQSMVHNPLAHQSGFQPVQGQQPTPSWSGYPHQGTAMPAADTLPAPRYYTPPGGLTRTAPTHGGPNTSSFNPMYPTGTHDQPQKSLSFASASRMQVSLQGLEKPPSGQPPPIRSYPQPAESQSQSTATAASKLVAISEPQRPHKIVQQLQQQQPQQPQSQSQPLPQLPLQPQRHSQQPQPQPQWLPEPSLRSQQHCQQSQAQPPSQRPLQPPQTHLQAPPRSADSVLSTGAFQPPPQPTQPTVAREQARQQVPQPRADQTTFIRFFQVAVQGGISQLKTFWSRAKAFGISDEWFEAAISSLPPDVWRSVMTQVNQSGPTLDTLPPKNTPQQVSTIPDPNVPVVSVLPPLTTTPSVQTTLSALRATKPSTSAEGRTTQSASGQNPGLYTTQLQYYAEQATKSVLSAPVANISTPARNNAPMEATVATPKQDIPRAQTNMRTPRDANKSTLARDILRSLGKTAPKPRQETSGEATATANNHEGDQLPDVTPSRPVFRTVSPKPSTVPPVASIADADSPSVASATANVANEPQRVASPSLSMAKTEGHGQSATEGPVMIDLTLEDSDGSVDGKGQGLTLPIQTSTSAVTSSQPVSPTNTTNQTPLLEHLSLKEPPVDVVADGDNADVPMHSPPLPFAGEESMNSEPLYSSLRTTEPASARSQQLPRETSEHPNGQLPLFLPSPPVSPAPTEPPETDFEVINDECENTSSLKRRSVDVDEREFDTGMVKPQHVRKRQKQQVYVLIPPAPFYVKKVVKKAKEHAMGEGLDLEGVGEDKELQYNHLEQLLVDESKSRLLERRCRWLSCGAILNCAANLLAHLLQHAHEEGAQSPCLCRWAGCQRQFGTERERDGHLSRHTTRPLPCPFAGCDEQFDQPVAMVQHEMQHQNADNREPLVHKSTCQPIVPVIPARLGPPPQRLPCHRVIPRRVIKCRISADRHAIVGPWVLWNIFSPIDLNMRKQNASMRSRPTRQPVDYDTDSSDPRRDDYDFLMGLSSYPAKNPQLDDLDSTLITMSAAQGLTLWGSGSAVRSAARSATPGEYVDAVSVTLAVDVAVPSCAPEKGTEEKKRTDGSEAAGRQSGEEDVVEGMLNL